MITYSIWLDSLRWNMASFMKKLKLASSTTYSMTLTIPTHEFDRRIEELSEQKIIVTYNLLSVNSFEPKVSKEDRIIRIEVRFSRLDNDEQGKVVDVLQEHFVPGLNMLMWNSNGSSDIADYTEITGSYIKDFHESGGYNGNDGRYVLVFDLNIKYPR